MSAEYCSTELCESLTMSAVAEVLGTIVEETGRAAAGSHPLQRATSTEQLKACLSVITAIYIYSINVTRLT